MSGSQAAVADQEDGAGDRVEIEARATRMGWQPREKFRGRGEWVDAPEYVERGERILPLLQERNRTLDRTVKDLQSQMGQQSETLASLVRQTRAAEIVGYKRAVRELQAKRDAAIDEGDKVKVHAAEAELRELGPEPQPIAERQPNNQGTAPDPAVVDFARRNPWFNSDRSAKGYAIGLLDDVQAEQPGWSLSEQLDEVEARVRRRFPELFPRQRRDARTNGNALEEDQEVDDEPRPRTRRAAMVTPSNSAAARQPGARSFEAMPAEAKREWQRQAKMMEGKGEPFSKEEYARYYWEAETGEAA